MANKQSSNKLKSRVSNNSQKWLGLPRWAIIVVTFVVAVVGIVLVYNSFAVNSTRLFCVQGNCTQRDPNQPNQTIINAWVRPSTRCSGTNLEWAVRRGNAQPMKRDNQWVCVATQQQTRGATAVFPVPGGSLSSDPSGGHGTYTAYDILAPPGTPVKVYKTGVIQSIGNYSVYITGEDGLLYSYIHIDVAGGLARGQRVTAGTVIGTVSGSSASGNNGIPHLHFDASRQASRSACSRDGCSNSGVYLNIHADLARAQAAQNRK